MTTRFGVGHRVGSFPRFFFNTLIPLKILAGSAASALALVLALLGGVLAPAHAADLGAQSSKCLGSGCPAVYNPPNVCSPPNSTGYDEAYNIVAGGNLNISGEAAEIEGRIYIGGAINDNKGPTVGTYNMVAVGVGACVTPRNSTDTGTPALFVGGNINVPDPGNSIDLDGGGLVFDALVGGVHTGAGPVNSLGTVTYGAAVPGSPVNFSTLRSNSAFWGALPSTGTIVNPSSTLTFTGDGSSALQVFNYTGGSISGSVFDFENIPATSTVVINVATSGNLVFDVPDFFVNGSNSPDPVFTRHTVWNFINASNVTVTGTALFLGSVIVPNGGLVNGVAGLNGRVIVSGDLGQNGTGNEFHNYEFVGNLPDPATLVFTKAYGNNTPNHVSTQPAITVRAVCSTSGTKTVSFTPPATGSIANLYSGESCTLTETSVSGGVLSGGYTFAATATATFSGSNPRILGAGSNAITLTNTLVSPAPGDISVKKTLDTVNGGAPGTSVKAGDVLRYKLALTENTGTGAASVALSEAVPANTSYSGSAEGWSCAAGTCTQTAALAGGATATVFFTVTVASPIPDGVTQISNTVVPTPVTGTGSCLGGASGCSVSTPTGPKLNLLKTGNASIAAGASGSYSLQISNVGGSSTAGVVTVVDSLPANLSFAGQVSGLLSCSAVAQTVTCTGSPNLAAGGNLSVVYTVNAAVAASGTLTNSAQVSVGGGDPRAPGTCDNAATPAAGSGNQSTDKLCSKWSVAILSGSLQTSKALSSVLRAGVTLTGTNLPASVQAGDVLGYTITVQNTGSGSATTVLGETVPATTSYVGSAEGWGAGCAAAGSTCSQSVTVAGNSSVSKQFSVQVASPVPDNVTTIGNTVTATLGLCASCTVTEPTAPKLAVSKTLSAPLSAGGTATYTLTVSNLGGSATAGAVTLKDVLPNGLTFAAQASGTLAGVGCSAVGQSVTCTGSPTLASQASASVAYTVNVAVAASGTLTNDARFLAGAIGGDPRTPDCSTESVPAAGTNTQSSDKLCARASATVQTGTLATAKVLNQVNGAAVAGGYQVHAGDVLQYLITTTATGASASTSLCETQPANTVYSGNAEGWSAGQGACPAGTTHNQVVSVNPGTPVAVKYSVTVANPIPDNVTTISNLVGVTNGTCTSCAVSEPTVPKLALSKTISSPLNAGGTGTYTLTLSNLGGSASSSAISLTDSLPVGLSFAAQAGGTLGGLACSAVGQTVTCTGSPSLGVAASGTLAYSVNVAVSASGTLTNAAQFVGGQIGGDPRTPSCASAVVPAAGASSQSTDKLCARASASIVAGTPLTSKTLFQVNTGSGLVAAPSSGFVAHGGDILQYQVSTSIAVGGAITTVCENLPANTSYSGSGEGWIAGQGACPVGTTHFQQITVNAAIPVNLTYTVKVGNPIPDNVTTITNTVRVTNGLCVSCNVLTPTAPKLSLLKSGNASIAAGGTGSYTLQISNLGGSPTTGVVTVVDTLPTNLSFASQTSGALGCSAVGQTVTCTGSPNLAAGGSLSVVYTVNAAVAATGTLTNSAKITAGGGDPRPPSACDNAGTPTAGNGNQSSDKLCAKWSLAVLTGSLQASKSLSSVLRGGTVLSGASLPATVQGGDRLTYTIMVQNTGGGSATSSLGETVPANTSYVGSGEGWSAGCVGGGSSCSQSVTLGGNTSLSKQFTVLVVNPIPDNVTTIGNTATLGGTVCCVVNTPTPPKLRLNKTGPASIPAGGVGNYTVTLTNNGGSSTSGLVDFTDTLPVGQTFVLQSEVTTLVCSNDPSLTIGRCSGTPNLLPGQTMTVTYQVSVAANASGNLTNAIVPSSPLALAGDPRTPNCDNAAAPAAGAGNVSSDGLCAKWTVGASAGTLATAKTLNLVNGASVPVGYQVHAGDVLQYQITSTASGASAISSICETLPANTSYSGVGEGWSAGQGACPAGTTHNQVVTVNLGTPVSLFYTVQVANPLADNVTTITNAVKVTNGSCASCSVSKPTAPKLTLAKTLSAPLNAGGSAIYTLTLGNLGGSATAGPLTIRDVLPSGLGYSAQTAGTLAGMSCSAAAQTVTCTGSPILAPGASATIAYSVNVAVSAAGVLTNDARYVVGAIGGDPRTPNCSTEVIPAAGASSQSGDKLCARASAQVSAGQLLVSKSLLMVNTGSGFVAPSAQYQAKGGDQLRYQISITEVSGAAASATLTETVPNNSSYSGSAENWSAGCVGAGTTCSQTVSVAANGAVKLLYTVTVGNPIPDNVTTLTNTVTAQNAICVACTVLTPTRPKLNLIKSGGASMGAGGSGSYTLLVSNVGGSTTSGVVTLTDTLPANLSFAAQNSGSLACSAVGQTVTCTGTPNLAAGGTLKLVYTVNAAAAASGILTNSAQITVGGGDPRPPSACDNSGTPAANAGNQSSDKLCSKWSLAVLTGNPQTNKVLSSVLRGGLTLSGASLPAYIQPGDVLTYGVTVQNTAGVAVSTVVGETVPQTTSYVGTGEGWGAGCASAGSSCNQSVSVGPNSAVKVTFTVQVASVIPDNVTQISNTVTTSAGPCVICSVSDPTATKLRIVKSGPASIPAGSAGTYSVILTNVGGSSTAGLVNFTDTLPAGQTFVDQSEITTLTCPANSTLTVGNCAGTPNLAPGQSMRLTYQASVASGASGNLTNVITPTVPLALAGDPRTPNCDNASAPAPGAGNVSGDGLCTKWTVAVTTGTVNTVKTLTAVNGQNVPSGYSVRAGDVLQYTLTSTASTAAAATTLCEALPANTVYSGAAEGWSAGQGACPAGTSHNQVVSVLPGSPVSKTYTVSVANPLPANATSITNTVAVTAGTCSSCTVNVPINGLKALNTIKTLVNVLRAGSNLTGAALPSLLLPGDVLTYRLTTTETVGQLSATTVLSETVSAGASFVGNAALWPGCNSAGSTCSTSVTLAAHQSSSVDFVVQVDMPLDPSITEIANQATSSAGLCNSCSVRNAIGASLSGTVWLDLNHDRKRDPGEPPVAGVLVQLLDAQSQPVSGIAAVRTDSNGNYAIAGLQAGVSYQVQFRSADNSLVYGVPTYDDSLANTVPGTTAQLASGTSTIASNFAALTVVLKPGANMVRQSLPLDPSGVVYNSATRTPVGGAVVGISGPVGFTPASQLVGGASAAQQTTSLVGGVPGGYQFLLLPSAPAGRYCLDVSATGYTKSTSLLPAGDALQVPPGPGVYSVNKDNLTGVPPPQVGQDTTYYFCFVVDPQVAPYVVHNHLPLDVAANASLVVSKVVDRPQASVGDLVRYTVRVTVANSAPATALSVQDHMALGFSMIPGTWVLEKTGTKTIAPQRVADPAPLPGSGNQGAGWKLVVPANFLPLQNGEQLLISYRVRVGVGAMQGDGINRVRAYSGTAVSNEATATVTVSGGVFDNASCVVGKVFIDCNNNHVQDAKELGIPFVRLYLEDGTFVITDSEGKYSLCGLRAIDHVIKIDPLTLPPKARMTTSSNRNLGDADSLILDARGGLLLRGDFVEGSCAPPVVDDVMRRRARGEANGRARPQPDAQVTTPPMIRFEGRPANQSRATGAQQ